MKRLKMFNMLFLCYNMILAKEKYENDTLSRVLIADGYIDCKPYRPAVYFYLKDHQGNNRIVLDKNDSIMQVNHYYPFGALFGESTNGGLQKYKYNGKELERMYELDLYDYGARWMDPVLGGRFTSIDPLCEKYYSISSYAYCGNNPINRIDPDGRDWVFISDERGARYEWRDAVSSPNDIYEEGVQYVGRHMTDVLIFAGIEVPSDLVTNTDTQIHTDMYGIEHEIDIYEIDGNYWGNEAFQFLADHTNVEWTLFNIGRTEISADGKSYLTTSKEYRTDYGNRKIAPLLNKPSVVYPKMNVLSHIHNHPRGTRVPSGNDLSNANNLRLRYPFVKSYIYNKSWGKLLY